AGPSPAAPSSQRMKLTAEQGERLVAGIATMLRGAATGRTAPFPAELAELRDQLVSGAFVSLKRGRHLRSCTGLLGQTVPLYKAMEEATYRTIWEDERFPNVSAAELDYLGLEVWLLYNPQPVQARGEDRIREIRVGEHGIQVVRGPSRGLFLPSVAVESNW